MSDEPVDPRFVKFVNKTDVTVTFITLSQHDSTPRWQFTLQPRGSHLEKVPGKDARTYEELLMVVGEDENGQIEQNVGVTTDELRKLTGKKLIVNRAGEGYKLDQEEVGSGSVHSEEINADRTYGEAAARRHEVEVTPVLKLHLQDWEEEKKQQLASVESYRRRCNTTKSETYQLMGFYFVFQGLLISVVSSGAKLTCPKSVLPAGLSLLASIATGVSIHFKLTYHVTQKLKFIEAEQEATDIIRKIRFLKRNGRGYVFESKTKTEDEREKKHRQEEVLKEKLKQKKKTEREDRDRDRKRVMGFLVIVAVMVVASCFIFPCI